MSDWRLIRQYVEEKSDTAFSHLLDRHIKMVYWTCRRELSDPQRAEDATQEVFILLARKAASIGRNVSLSGWLFNTARLVCRNVRRTEARKRRLDEEARRSMEASTSIDQEWQGIEPHLNEALAALPAFDREIILRRYIDGFSLREIAAETGATENALGKRAARAIDQLRLRLEKRGASVTSLSLIGFLTDRSAPDAPAACKAAAQKAVASLALHQSSSHAAHSHTTLIHKGVNVLMELSRLKIAAIVASTVVIGTITAGSAAVYNVRHDSMPPSNFAAAVRWEEARLSQESFTTIVEGGPFYMVGANKPLGTFWMVRGIGTVNVLDTSGKIVAMSSFGMPKNCKFLTAACAWLFTPSVQETDQEIKNPQIAVAVGGNTTYVSGYGLHAIKDSAGRTLETLQVQPPS